MSEVTKSWKQYRAEQREFAGELSRETSELEAAIDQILHRTGADTIHARIHGVDYLITPVAND